MSMDRLRRQAQTHSQSDPNPNRRQIAPGKVTRTGTLSTGAGPVQRKASAAGSGVLAGRTPAGLVQRKPAAADTQAGGRLVDDWTLVALRPDLHQEPIQCKNNEIGYAPAGAPAPQSGGGHAMPAAVQAKMEDAFGADFSAVRIHEGPEAASIGALAYTRGTNIHVAPGQYRPDTQRGQELLGHELAHVVQQSQGRVRPTTQAKGVDVNDDEALEREADEMGARATQGRQASMGPAGPLSSSSGAGGPAVQRLLAVRDPEGALYADLTDPGFFTEAHIALREHEALLDACDRMDFPGVWGNYLENYGLFRHYLTKAYNGSKNHGVFDLREDIDVVRLYHLLKDAVLGDLGARDNAQDFPDEPSALVKLSEQDRSHILETIDSIEEVQDRYGMLEEFHRDLFQEIDNLSLYLAECLTQNCRPREMSLDEQSQEADRLMGQIEGLVKSKDEVIAAIITQAELARAHWTVAQPAQMPQRFDTGFHGPNQDNAIVTKETVDQIIKEWRPRIKAKFGIAEHRLHDAKSGSGPRTYQGVASFAWDFLIQVYYATKWLPVFNFHIEVLEE